jgi:hypothetical protein
MDKSALSTWVSLDVHEKFREYCNQKGVSLSEGLKDLVLETLGLSNNIEENPQPLPIQQILKYIGEKNSKRCKHSDKGFCTYWSFSEEDIKKFDPYFRFEKDNAGWDDYHIEIITQICTVCSGYEYQSCFDKSPEKDMKKVEYKFGEDL